MPGSHDQLYFAYGSNLWLQQMAARCPGSSYVGRAILPEHRWQINERGYANVIPCSGYSVHGLVYRVSVDDENKLDRNEGVNSGAYSKSYEKVILYPAVSDLQQPTRQIIEDGGLAETVNALRHRGSRVVSIEREPVLKSNVLVYLSENYVRWSHPRDEYIDRMNFGIRDSIALGIPADFFQSAVRPLVPFRQTSTRVQPRVRQQNLAAPSHTRGHQRTRSAPEEPRSRSTGRSRSTHREPSPDRRTRVSAWTAPIYRSARSVSRGPSRAPRDRDDVYYY